MGNASSKGFYAVKCGVCNDYKLRGGFKFENGEIGYNCFNCGKSARYEEGSGKISRNMRQVLNAFDIDDTDISAIVNSAFFNKPLEPTTINLNDIKKINVNTPTIKLPDQVHRLGATLEELDYQQKLVSYLLDRCIDLDTYPFFFSTETRFKDRVIIPFYKNGNLIFWQARSINSDEKKRYDSAAVSNSAVIFNCDALNHYTSSPLLVSEGVFDAMMFDGIALVGSKLTEAKIELLSRSRRRLIFVIDKDANGKHLAEKVLELGWEITVAPDGANDVNDSVRKYGKTYTALHLMKNVCSGGKATLLLSVKCK